MGRQVLLSVFYYLTLSQTFGDIRTHSLIYEDNVSAESAPRLYRSVPLGVYASAAPHAAYSFHLPTFAAAPKPAASQTTPAKENFVNHLTDSYGNKFVGTPQLTTYQIAFPQQYVPLPTKLPEHLAQPLVAASANFQFKQANGQFFGTPFRLPVVQGAAATSLNHFPTFRQLYGDKVKNLAYSTVTRNQPFVIPNTQQQSTNYNAVFTNTKAEEQYNNLKNKPIVSQPKKPQIIIGKTNLQGTPKIPSETLGETRYQKIQEAPQLTTQSQVQFQRIQDASHAHANEAAKFQTEAPHSHHSEVKLQLQTPQSIQSSEEEETYNEHEVKLPHYESKFQIIHDKPHLQAQSIKENYASDEEVSTYREPEVTKQHSYQHHEKLQYKQPEQKPQISYKNKPKLQVAPAKQTITYINDINGKKTIVELDSQPKLPLLDITLLEPLKFDKTFVPQVQHFLPKISHATYKTLPELNLPIVKNYQKDYVVQKTTSYGANLHENTNKDAAKKKFKKPTSENKYAKKNEAPHKAVVTYHDSLEDAPEITYEITAPNYKETIKEKSVNYNKQTQSAPVSYTYGSSSAKEPVTYSFSRTSQEPIQIKTIQYHGNGPAQHLLYNFRPEEPVFQERSHNSAPHHNEAKNNKQSSHESHEEGPVYHTQHHIQHPQQFKHQPYSAEGHSESLQKENEKFHKEDDGVKPEVVHDNPPKYYSEPTQFTSENIDFQPIIKEYQNNIRLLSTPSASIKVDPHQHVQQEVKSAPQSHGTSREEHSQTQHQAPPASPAPQTHTYSTPEPQNHHHQSAPQPESYNTPVPHIHEKSKRIIIHEEAPDETHMLTEQMREEVVNQEENSEEDFEKAYQDAAIGFPAFDQKSSEKDVFDPESYGVPRDHVKYDFENTPFQQYQEEGDDFPKESRTSYRDARDKIKENYYSDFSISKPESMLDRYQNKLGYYKLFKQQKPEYMIVENKENQESAKYSVAPSFGFLPSVGKSYYGQSTPKQQLYEYDFSQGAPRDSSAFASRPQQSFKRRTNFVEPQFQYGFEPLAVPKLLDSELAAMASNNSPESEKPGMRKKVYKENWYIKKTSTSAGAPDS